MNVVVQVPAYQEGAAMKPVLEQIVAQDPAGHDVDVEAWVTLSPPRKAECTTWQAAQAVDGVEVIEAPAGKLSARNEAHDSAVERGADVIVSWDADALPANRQVLASLVAPIDGPDDMVISNSTPRASVNDGSLLAGAVDVFSAIEDAWKPHVHGQCHAMSRAMWRELGPFPADVDETDIHGVREVEEFGFYQRATSIGRVVDADGAVVCNDPRRAECRVRDATSVGRFDAGFCGRRGIETFSPANPHRDDCGCGKH